MPASGTIDANLIILQVIRPITGANLLSLMARVVASTSRDGWDKIGEWTRMKRLGKGGFGAVYLGKRKSDEKLFAVKSTYFVPLFNPNANDPMKAARQKVLEDDALSSLINEIRTLRKLKSPYIVRYLGCGTSTGPPEMDGRLLLDCYLEYLPRGSLGDLFDNPLEEPFVKAYTKDILRALVYLHFNKIVHGDLKCVNVLMDSNNCKLADFGSAKDVRTSFFSKILFGTRGYKAPEVESCREQTYASDIFSLGCTVQEMATGEAPEPLKWPVVGSSSSSASKELTKQNLSDNLMDFLSKCLADDPRVRWSASDLLKHPFITELSSPRWLPYDITPPSILVGEHKGIIVPPNDLSDPGFPQAPFSPIHVVPMKRRKIGFSCTNAVSESAVVVPGPPPPWSPPPKDAPDAPWRDSASDNQSGNSVTSYFKSPPLKLDSKTPRSRNRNERQHSGGKRHGAQSAIKRLSLAPRVALAEMRRQKSEEGSTFYKGYKVEFASGVAQLKGADTDEDKSPLVVKICSEFDIPLPPEYQRWILDPDYDPTTPTRANVDTSNTVTNIVKKAIITLRLPIRFN